MAFKINTRNLTAFARRFNDPSTHRKGAMRAGAEHVTLIQEAFDHGGVDEQTGRKGAWPQKAIPVQLPGQPKRRQDPKPRLQDTGALVQSMTFNANDKGYEVGPSPLPYAAVHQFGAKIPISRKMRGMLRSLGFFVRKAKTHVEIPARPYVVLPPAWATDIGDAYLSAKTEEV